MKVCIATNQDGTYSVYEEPENDTGADQSAGSQDQGNAGAMGYGQASPDQAAAANGQATDTDEQPQTAQTIDQALSIAKQLLTGESGENEGDNGQAEAMFQQGFKSTRGEA